MHLWNFCSLRPLDNRLFFSYLGTFRSLVFFLYSFLTLWILSWINFTLNLLFIIKVLHLFSHWLFSVWSSTFLFLEFIDNLKTLFSSILNIKVLIILLLEWLLLYWRFREIHLFKTLLFILWWLSLRDIRKHFLICYLDIDRKLIILRIRSMYNSFYLLIIILILKLILLYLLENTSDIIFQILIFIVNNVFLSLFLILIIFFQVIGNFVKFWVHFVHYLVNNIFLIRFLFLLLVFLTRLSLMFLILLFIFLIV